MTVVDSGENGVPVVPVRSASRVIAFPLEVESAEVPVTPVLPTVGRNDDGEVDELSGEKRALSVRN